MISRLSVNGEPRICQMKLLLAAGRYCRQAGPDRSFVWMTPHDVGAAGFNRAPGRVEQLATAEPLRPDVAQFGSFWEGSPSR